MEVVMWKNGGVKWKMEVGKWKSETRSGMAPIGHSTYLTRRYISPPLFRLSPRARNIRLARETNTWNGFVHNVLLYIPLTTRYLT